MAGYCGHTCCEGWEIDIDPDSFNCYMKIESTFGKKLQESISRNPTPHFILQKDSRCPLLTSDNLCEMILELGANALCQICSDHPRFRNYWSDRIEIGLGMACEAAGRLILLSDHPHTLLQIGEECDEETQIPSEEEKWLWDYRNEWIASLNKNNPESRLKEYLIYRHLADALYDGQIEERIQFINTAYERILSEWNGKSLEELVQHARVFSNEFEYDDEGIKKLLSHREK